jgi:hypothetical protein
MYNQFIRVRPLTTSNRQHGPAKLLLPTTGLLESPEGTRPVTAASSTD